MFTVALLIIAKIWKQPKCPSADECKNKMRGTSRAGGAVVKNLPARASLVAQWLRIRLPMQGTRVRALVWEGLTCRRATKPVHHNY